MTPRYAAKEALNDQRIELPSWAFGNSGTRFKVFGPTRGAAHPAREDRRRGSDGRLPTVTRREVDRR